MKYNVLPLNRLIEQFASLPGIGRKTAQRLAFYMLTVPKEKAQAFADAILEAQEKIHYCSVCKITPIRKSVKSVQMTAATSR